MIRLRCTTAISFWSRLFRMYLSYKTILSTPYMSSALSLLVLISCRPYHFKNKYVHYFLTCFLHKTLCFNLPVHFQNWSIQLTCKLHGHSPKIKWQLLNKVQSRLIHTQVDFNSREVKIHNSFSRNSFALWKGFHAKAMGCSYYPFLKGRRNRNWKSVLKKQVGN